MEVKRGIKKLKKLPDKITSEADRQLAKVDKMFQEIEGEMCEALRRGPDSGRGCNINVGVQWTKSPNGTSVV